MSTNIPFGKPLIKKEEKNAVSKILKNPILVHGPKTPEFEAYFLNLQIVNILLLFLHVLLVYIYFISHLELKKVMK